LSDAAARLNRDCRCIGVDAAELSRQLARAGMESGLDSALLHEHAHLFAAVPVFLSRAQVDAIAEAVHAVEAVVATPAWQAVALADAPAIARHPVAARGLFFGHDFHVGPEGPRLIEINTNAGGALLNVFLARAQRACCEEVRALVAGQEDLATPDLERAFVEDFRAEWRLARGDAPLESVVIVDDTPERQYLYPEFVLFRESLRRAGLRARIAPPEALTLEAGRLLCEGERVDLVYSRLTDFYFAEPAHAVLREAYLADAAVVTPHPRAHAIYASKANLVRLSDEAFLRSTGVTDAVVRTLLEVVPRTARVRDADPDALWRERKTWFFKPIAGYGSKAAYRGDKLTRGVFGDILAGDYVAQRVVPPSERTIELDGETRPLKLDVRAYVYAGVVQLVVSRLWHGQTTNFRTQGGGFAPVFTERPSGSEGNGGNGVVCQLRQLGSAAEGSS
jgi:hypothetical protein